MKNFKLWILSLISVTAASPALAIPVLSISPTNQTHNFGDPVFVDVMVKDFLPDFVGAYDFNVTWDATLLSLSDFDFSAALGADVIEGFSSSSGSVSAFQVALGDLSHQTGFGEMRLFSMTFDTLSAGTSALDFVGNLSGNGFLADGFGNELPALTASGSITIRAPVTSVPEPGSLALLVAGLVAMGWASRRGARLRSEQRSSNPLQIS